MFVDTEEWKIIEGFPNYEISSLGRVFNRRTEQMMRTSKSNFGHMKISLLSEDTERRVTKSVARLVAEAFIGPSRLLWDQVILLDGDFENVQLSNLAWRPRSFAWRYRHQLHTHQPRHFQNLPVLNVHENVEYENVIQAGMAEGLLFPDIWRSTYTGEKVFPTGSVFKIVNRV